jgi:hypothetical protein
VGYQLKPAWDPAKSPSIRKRCFILLSNGILLYLNQTRHSKLSYPKALENSLELPFFEKLLIPPQAVAGQQDREAKEN